MVTIFGKPWDKQLLDQTAHCLGGIGLAALLSTTITALEAIPYVAAFAIGREIIQHRSFSFGWGRTLDVSFFIVGSMVWAATLYLKN